MQLPPPTTAEEMIRAIYIDVQRLEKNLNEAMNLLRKEQESQEDRINKQDARLVSIERVMWVMTWIGGPIWGILLLVIGAIVGNLVGRAWPLPR